MKLLSRARTVAALIRHFTKRERLFLAPLLLVLLLSSVLLFLTGGFGYIAPFVYALF